MEESTLVKKADQYAHAVYRATRNFPKEELFGINAQIRRAALSVPLNITEGFGRQSIGTYRQFLKISYASLKESLYLVEFSFREHYLHNEEYRELKDLGQEVAKMLWVAIRTLGKNKS